MNTKRWMLLFGLLGMLAAAPARAALIWSWDLKSWSATVGQNDSILIRARIHNDISSTQGIDTSSFSLLGFGYGFDFPYTGDFPFGGFPGQLQGRWLVPGQSFDFVFARLTPVDPPVAPGVYSAHEFRIWLQDVSGQESQQQLDGRFEIRVVPEPPAWVLVLSALGLLGLARSSASDGLRRRGGDMM